MTPEDKDLIVRAIRGESDAINQVVVQYGEFANRIAWKIVKNSADAADITQEVLIKLVFSLHTLKVVEGFQSWLYRITYRVSLNWLRTQSKFVLVEDACVEEGAADEAHEQSKKQEQLTRIAEAAEALPYPYLVIVKMFYFEDRSCREIAGVLGSSEGAIKVQVAPGTGDDPKEGRRKGEYNQRVFAMAYPPRVTRVASTTDSRQNPCTQISARPPLVR